MYSLSALYMLQSVPIVKVILVILFKKKKKKKKKKTMTRTSVWVKIPVMPQKTPLSIFSLGKRGNPSSPTLKKKLKLSVLSAPPSSTQNIFQIQALCKQRMPKFTQNGPKIHFLCKFCTFPVTEGYAI